MLAASASFFCSSVCDCVVQFTPSADLRMAALVKVLAKWFLACSALSLPPDENGLTFLMSRYSGMSQRRTMLALRAPCYTRCAALIQAGGAAEEFAGQSR